MTKNLSKTERIAEEITTATIEGVVKLARTIQKYGFGNIFIKIPELGLYIKNSSKQDIKFLNSFCELYDCVIPMKLIKSEVFSDTIKGIPVNILTYSDFTEFFGNIKNVFEAMLESGLCRRFTFSFQKIQKLTCANLSDEEERNIYKQLEELGKNLFDTFMQVQDNSCYKLMPESKDLLNRYKNKLYEMYNEIEDRPLIKKELLSREYKSLKLSCLYACINHPQELVINTTDMEQAIKTVEFLCKDFIRFTQYSPQLEDKYDKAYNYLKQNYGKAFTKTHLVNTLSREFGFNRERLRKNFSKEFYPIINELAAAEGYYFNIAHAERNGNYYYLAKMKDYTIPEKEVPLSELIKDMKFPKLNFTDFTVDLLSEFGS